MDYREITKLAYQYADALEKELELSTHVLNMQASLERTEARIVEQATADGKVDGKNADTRKAQRAAIIAAAPEVEKVREVVEQAKRAAALAEIECKRFSALIGLTKAWLRSQAGE